MDRRNIYDYRDSLELGTSAEEKFKKIAKSKKWVIKLASRNEDKNEHWDCEIFKKTESYKVDVKAMKRVSRHDSETQDVWLWIELHGVRVDDRGWLYGDKADLIAFELCKSFIIVEREQLIRLVEELVDFDRKVYTSLEAKYKVYSRRGRPDRITLVEAKKLFGIKWAVWGKL